MSLIKLFEDENYILSKSDTSYKRNVIYFNSAAGLDRIGINDTFYPDPSHAPKDKPIDGIFTNNCINEYNLIAKKADWFQQETLNDFIKILKLNILGSEQETICYGSSMGGFASLHLAPLLEVKKVLAFSPQVSLNPEFGIRPTWYKVHEFCKFNYGGFKSNIINGRSANLEAYIFYDNFDYLDYKQSIEIKKYMINAHLFHVPYTGHGGCMSAINKAIGIKKIIISILENNLNLNEIKETCSLINYPKKYYAYKDCSHLVDFADKHLNLLDKLAFYSFQAPNQDILIKKCIDFINSRSYINSKIEDFIKMGVNKNENLIIHTVDISQSVAFKLDKKLCTGCAACSSICSKNAITMIPDQFGFYKPSIDNSKCNNCGLCSKKCIVLNPKYNNDKNPKCFAFLANDNIRKESSSGGFFKVAFSNILKNNGLVVGAKYNTDFSVQHEITDNKQIAQTFMGSKYIQSDVSKIYQKVKEQLKIGKKVLFTGLPCQVAGLKSYLIKDYENLITIDLFCHGIASHKIFLKYHNDVLKGKELLDLQFKRKEPWGWHAGVNAFFKDGSKYSVICGLDPYFQAYFLGYIKNTACSSCKFNHLPRQGDLSIGDFWGIDKFNKELNDNLGTSAILINNKKGEEFFFNLSDGIKKIKEVPINFAIAGNLSIKQPYPINKDRNLFLNYLFDKQMNFSDLLNIFKYRKLFMLTFSLNKNETSVTEYKKDEDLFSLANYVYQHYDNRKIVTWVYSEKFNKILKDNFGLDIEFPVSLINKTKSIHSLFELKNQSHKYYLVVLDREYDLHTEKIIRDLGFKYGDDCAFRRIKRLSISNLDLDKQSYIDDYGNTVEGFGIIGKITFLGYNNHIIFGKNIRGLSHLSIVVKSNTFIEIKDNITILEPSKIRALTDDFSSTFISIGQNCFFTNFNIKTFAPSMIRINQSLRANSNLSIGCCQGRKIIIGKDCLFASDVDLQSGDGHTIFDVISGKLKNKSINNTLYIGDHVWIGKRALILNGTALGCGSIVGAGSIVKGKFENNSTVGGNPAKQINRNICWSIDGSASSINSCPKQYVNRSSSSNSPICGLNVLVVGGTHRIGIQLVNQLIELGNNVTIITRGKTKDNFGHYITRLQADVSNLDEVQSVLQGKIFDVVFDNLAYNLDYVENIAKNVICNKYIILSSCAVYADKPNEYSIGKINAENGLFDKFNNKSPISVRLPPILPDPRLSIIFNSITNSSILKIDNLNKLITFVSAEEVARFLVWIANQNYSGKINFSFSGTCTLNQIINYFSDKLDKSPTVNLVEPSSSQIIYPDFSSNKMRLFLNLDQLKKLGFSPIDINEGLWKSIDEMFFVKK